MAKQITINVKLYSGLEKELGLSDYDPYKGVDLTLSSGTRLKKALQPLGFKKRSYHAIFCNGERSNLWRKVEDGDEISLIIPSAGG